jgi:signal transduction histidine kinase
MSHFLKKLLDSPILQRVLSPFRPRSEKADEAFRERTIRFFTIVSLLFFGAIILIDVSSLSFNEVIWYGSVYLVGGLVLGAVHFRRVQLASRLMIVSLLLLLLDDSRAFWSPGTILFSLMFSFMFQMVLGDWRDIVVAEALNLAIYTYIAFAGPAVSPLDSRDYFSERTLALLTTYVAHFFIIGVAYYIRREQQERSQMELLSEKQQLTILRQFINHNSHDLRTPITTLKVRLYILERKYPNVAAIDWDKIRYPLSDLELMVSAMLEMLELDDTSRFVEEALDLDKMVRDVISMYQAESDDKHLVLNYQPANAQLIVSADNIYLRRAIGNVLENAIDYTPAHGQIQIRTEQIAKKICIEIQDTGIGIAPEHIPLIFEHFYRVDAARNQERGRNGMGLAISKKIIELHHGEIRVDSVEHQGTRVRIMLPA